MLAQVIAFYAISPREAFEMPMRQFWLLCNSVSRIEADQDRRALRIALCAQSEKGSMGLLGELTTTVGEVVRKSAKAVLFAPLDREGLDDLRKLSQLGV